MSYSEIPGSIFVKIDERSKTASVLLRSEAFPEPVLMSAKKDTATDRRLRTALAWAEVLKVTEKLSGSPFARLEAEVIESGHSIDLFGRLHTKEPVRYSINFAENTVYVGQTEYAEYWSQYIVPTTTTLDQFSVVVPSLSSLMLSASDVTVGSHLLVQGQQLQVLAVNHGHDRSVGGFRIYDPVVLTLEGDVQVHRMRAEQVEVTDMPGGVIYEWVDKNDKVVLRDGSEEFSTEVEYIRHSQSNTITGAWITVSMTSESISSARVGFRYDAVTKQLVSGRQSPPGALRRLYEMVPALKLAELIYSEGPRLGFIHASTLPSSGVQHWREVKAEDLTEDDFFVGYGPVLRRGNINIIFDPKDVRRMDHPSSRAVALAADKTMHVVSAQVAELGVRSDAVSIEDWREVADLVERSERLGLRLS